MRPLNRRLRMWCKKKKVSIFEEGEKSTNNIATEMSKEKFLDLIRSG